MNIVFFGSSRFAVPSLMALKDSGHTISCVITQPDRKKGRGLHLEPTPVALAAKGIGLRIHQPPEINSAAEVKFLKNLNAELFVVVSYGQILSQEVLNLPKKFAINAHASILPKYRGAAPVNWAIINGEKTTGVAIIKMTEKMDAGPILFKREIAIEGNDNEITLSSKLSGLGALLLTEAISLIEKTSLLFIEQDNNKATFAPKLQKKDGLISWENSAREIHNLIRGCIQWPGAYTYYGNKLVKFFDAEALPSCLQTESWRPGEVVGVSSKGIDIACVQGMLRVKSLQEEGRRRMPAAEFIAGHKLNKGSFFGKK